MTVVLEADLTLLDGVFREGVRVAIDDGRITAVGNLPDPPTRRLPGRALLPGMVNAHSHAFQRGLRGHGETFPDDAGSFWTWREAMYGLVEALDPERARELSCRAFSEMLAAGITTVGEFHYVHHADGAPDALDAAVIAAARDTGIRLVLLNVCYRRGGFDTPLAGGQKRFATASLAAYWDRMDELAAMLDPATQTLGVVAHSIRAVPIEEIELLHAESRRRGLVFHMHLEEQPREIEDTIAAHGRTPLALINERLDVDDRFTAVHLTHSGRADLATFLAAGGHACICPLTEGNLGDGLPDLPFILDCGGSVCLGSDSNARISFTEEMRWLEYAHRLQGQVRGVCRGPRGDVATPLWAMATANGARSLDVPAGVIEAGRHADLLTLDLDAAALRGWTPATLLAAFILGTGNEAIDDVCVGGRWLGPAPGSP